MCAADLLLRPPTDLLNLKKIVEIVDDRTAAIAKLNAVAAG
jgi:hypothetical protein